jgi:DNA recombination protein RmuC
MARMNWIILGLLVLIVVLLLWLVLRPHVGQGAAALEQALQAQLLSQLGTQTEALQARQSALARELRDEVHGSARGTRQELAQTLGQAIGLFQQTVLGQQGDATRTQNEQLDSFRVQLAGMQQSLVDTVRAMSEANERRLAEVRGTVETRLQALQADNDKRLEQMRQTVDEKLQATLEARLGESFKQVAERLEQVHKGLGEMQRLASDVGSLNRVLNNVKTRGIFGEVQLAGLLEQVFTPDQYGVNVETVPGTGARVEFAIRLPGRGHDAAPLWLPIDAKFPREDYERLLEAQDRADAPAAEQAAKAIEQRLRLEARSIRDKYLAPPHTTDFAILFLPTEGLFAEALRRPGLTEGLQREHRVVLAGPTTLLATLNSLQMGFRTLALEKRSSEVWQVLGGVKTEFGKFGEMLAKTKKKLDEASNTISQVETRSRAMGRALKDVEALPEPDQASLTTLNLLPSPPLDGADGADASPA